MSRANAFRRVLKRCAVFVEQHALWIMLAAAASYVVFFSVLGILDHWGLRTLYNDLGYAEQSLAQIAAGHPTLPRPGGPAFGDPRLAKHANFAFFAVAPLYVLFPFAETLLILASAAVAAAAVALFFLARHVLKRGAWGLLFGLALLINPLVQETNLFDFHVEVLALPFFLWAAYALERKRWGWYWLAVLLLLSVKEEMPFLVATWGIFVTVRHSRRHGLLTIGVAILSFLGIAWMMSHLGKGVGEDFPLRFGYLGGSVPDMLWTLLSDPGQTFHVILHPSKVKYLQYLGIQALPLGIFAPLALLAALPHACINLLDALNFQSRLTDVYYSGIIIAVAYAAGVYGLRRLRQLPRPVANIGVTLFAAQAVVIAVLMAPNPLSRHAEWRDFAILHDTGIFRSMLQAIPPGAVVMTQNNLGAHLARENIVIFTGKNMSRAKYMFFHIQLPFARRRPRSSSPYMILGSKTTTYRRDVLAAFDRPDFGVVSYGSAFYLLKRNHPRALNAQAKAQAQRELDNLRFAPDGTNLSLP